MSGLAGSDNKVEAFQATQVSTPQANNERGMTHLVAFTNSAVDSKELHLQTSIVELFATQDCWVLLKEEGQTNQASIPANKVKTYCKFVPGGVCTFVGIPKKENTRFLFSIIRNTADGTLYIHEGA